jgi:hypothetical protein
MRRSLVGIWEKKHLVREYSGGTNKVSFGTSQAHTRNPDKIREYLEHLPLIISSIMHRHPSRISAYSYKKMSSRENCVTYTN